MLQQDLAKTRKRRRRQQPRSSKVLLYTRVSTQEQKDSGLSLGAQRSALLAELERRGWNDYEWVSDEGYSASSLNRPGIQRALDKLDRGEASTLVVAKLDRLSRSILDFATMTKAATEEGWSIIALDYGLDMSTPMGEMAASMLMSFAEFERKQIAQRTRAALAVKKAQPGVRLGRRPDLTTDVRERIVRMHRTGQTYAAIADALNADGVPTARGGAKWYPATVWSVINAARRARQTEERLLDSKEE